MQAGLGAVAGHLAGALVCPDVRDDSRDVDVVAQSLPSVRDTDRALTMNGRQHRRMDLRKDAKNGVVMVAIVGMEAISRDTVVRQRPHPRRKIIGLPLDL